MKIKNCLVFSLPLLLISVSCKKATTSSNTTNGSSGSKVLRIQEGTNPNTDTLYFFHFTGSSTLADYIIDSFAGYPGNDTNFLTYDTYSRISYINSHFEGPQSFIFNPNGSLAEIDGPNDQYTFTYSGTTITGMQDVTVGYGINMTYDYTVNNAGDITEVIAYQGNHVTQVSDITYTYTSRSNTLFNLVALGSYYASNFWGLSTQNFAAMLSAHLPASYSDHNGHTVTYTYTYNGQNITQLLTADPATISGGFPLSTLQFIY